MDILIRKATQSDLPTLLELYSIFEPENAPRFNLLDAERIFSKINGYPNYTIYIAELDGQIVGTFALLIMDNLAHHGAPEGIVENVVVRLQMQRLGIGRIMMKRAMAICAEASCYKLVLSSNIKRERAHQFYESLGFEKYGYSFRVE